MLLSSCKRTAGWGSSTQGGDRRRHGQGELHVAISALAGGAGGPPGPVVSAKTARVQACRAQKRRPQAQTQPLSSARQTQLRQAAWEARVASPPPASSSSTRGSQDRTFSTTGAALKAPSRRNSTGGHPPCLSPLTGAGGDGGERAAALAGVTCPRKVSCRCFLPAARGWETLLQTPGSRAGRGPRAAPPCVSPGVQRAVWHLGARRSRVHVAECPQEGGEPFTSWHGGVSSSSLTCDLKNIGWCLQSRMMCF